jgi:hypothetical protein
MPTGQTVDARIRDAALRRLQRLTALAVAAATALAGIFAGLAAGSVPGRKAAPAMARSGGSLRLPQAAPTVRRHRARAHVAPAAPAPVTPAPPPAVPAPTQAAPVVVSGGS